MLAGFFLAQTLLGAGRLPGSDTSWVGVLWSSCSLPTHTRTQAYPHTGTPAHPPATWPSFSLAAPRPAHAPGRFLRVLRSFYSHPGRRTWAGPVVRWGSLTHTRRLPLFPPETGPPRPPARSPSPRLAPCRTPASLTPAAQARGHALAVTAAGPGAVLTRVSQSRFPGRAWSPELLSVRAGPSKPS
jgi:hypothetical protein